MIISKRTSTGSPRATERIRCQRRIEASLPSSQRGGAGRCAHYKDFESIGRKQRKANSSYRGESVHSDVFVTAAAELKGREEDQGRTNGAEIYSAQKVIV